MDITLETAADKLVKEIFGVKPEETVIITGYFSRTTILLSWNWAVVGENILSDWDACFPTRTSSEWI